VKLGIISDVHAQLDALKIAFDFLETQQVDQIVCAGDLVDRGDDGDAVVELIKKREIACVQGNHDKMAKLTQAFFDRNPQLDIPMESLKSETLDFLDLLPKMLRLELSGVTIVLVHDNPWHDHSDYIFPNSPAELLWKVVEKAQAQVVILGHTHLPMWVQCDDAIIVNSGAVSVNRVEYNQTCGILHLPDCEFEVYDINTRDKLALKPLILSKNA